MKEAMIIQLKKIYFLKFSLFMWYNHNCIIFNKPQAIATIPSEVQICISVLIYDKNKSFKSRFLKTGIFVELMYSKFSMRQLFYPIFTVLTIIVCNVLYF